MDALQSMHDLGVCHGDLRLENLLLNSSGEVCIIDFDLAIMNSEKRYLRKERRRFIRLLDAIMEDSVQSSVRVGGSAVRTSRAPVRAQHSRRVTRSMGNVRMGSSGMTLRPKRHQTL